MKNLNASGSKSGFGSTTKRAPLGGRSAASGRESAVGPGNYDAKDNYVRASQPSFTISKTKRGDNQSFNGAPGPGNYDSTANQ
jgi:hypothetical protein